MSTIENIRAELDSLTPATLVNMAECGRSDTETADAWLSSILRDITDAIVDWVDDNADSVDELRDSIDYDGRVHEVTDGAVPIYTSAMWSTFHAVGAHTEDPMELLGELTDMEDGARACLYIVAGRLAWALVDYVVEIIDEN